jgi:glycerol uptake facilitator protein
LSDIGAEIIGTALLILFGNGVVMAAILNKSKGEGGGWVLITFGWGFAVMVGAYAVGQFDGAALNPAVTLGLLIHGDGFTFTNAIDQWIGEIIGATIGQVLAVLVYWKHFEATEDQPTKLACFSTGPAIRDFKWNFVTEVIATMTLTLGIFAITNIDNGLVVANGLGTLLVAFLVVAIGMSLGGPTGYAINPTRDLMPRIVHSVLPIPGKGDSDWGYAWVPVLGPLVGGAIGAIIYDAFWPATHVLHVAALALH